MSNTLLELDLATLDKPTAVMQQLATAGLEDGKVVVLPSLPFVLDSADHELLDPALCDKKTKNISYNFVRDALSGISKDVSQRRSLAMKHLMQRYAMHCLQLLNTLFPRYSQHAKLARTSLRPVEIAGRIASSYRKDDTLLHVDAFPSTPTGGSRILRIFTNVHPTGKDRVWKVGEDLSAVVARYAPKISKPLPLTARLQKLFKITRGYRTLYDHYMLNIHNNMKADKFYQSNVAQQEIRFSPGKTWIVYTDQVSHAAIAGQHVLEQTFYLPVHALQDQTTAPLRVLEQVLQCSLVD